MQPVKRRETEIDDLIKVNLKTTFLHQTALTPNNIHSREKKACTGFLYAGLSVVLFEQRWQGSSEELETCQL